MVICKCGEEIAVDPDDTKDVMEVVCPKCGARYELRWVASSPALPGAQFTLVPIE
jgi:hypothetical protein